MMGCENDCTIPYILLSILRTFGALGLILGIVYLFNKGLDKLWKE